MSMTRFKALRRLCAGFTVPILLTACATLGIGQADQATRIIADLGCVSAAVGAGIQIAGDPVVNGAKTAMGVLAAIMSVGMSNVPNTVLAACKDTLAWATQDAKGAIALVTSGTGTPAATVPPPVTTPTRAAPPQPKAPTPVVIPIPKKN
jgi:hypothetical protein